MAHALMLSFSHALLFLSVRLSLLSAAAINITKKVIIKKCFVYFFSVNSLELSWKKINKCFIIRKMSWGAAAVMSSCCLATQRNEMSALF